MSILKLIFTAAVIYCVAIWLPTQQIHKERFSSAPKYMFWVWEESEDMRWLSVHPDSGVAFLVQTLTLSGDTVGMHYRSHPLVLIKNTYSMPVVHIEADTANPPTFSDEQIDRMVNTIMRVAANPNTKGLQIDFDAKQSERAGYKKLLFKLREALPPNMPLSMTALASWCAGDYWLGALAVDEVVPMYFRMGVPEQAKSDYLKFIDERKAQNGLFNCKCHSAIGLSRDEPIKLTEKQFADKRVYLFAPYGWQNGNALRNLAKDEER